VNFGPAHPSAHGVLRCILWLSGELISKAHISTGLLHRSSEKLIEFSHHLCSLPYFNRLDYVSMSSAEHTYCLSLESLWGVLCSLSDCLSRLYIVELTRSLNHYLALSCHSAESVLYYLFFDYSRIGNVFTCLVRLVLVHGYICCCCIGRLFRSFS
jgi:NADH:ubiquinone oxidoreductase subunit D